MHACRALLSLVLFALAVNYTAGCIDFLHDGAGAIYANASLCPPGMFVNALQVRDRTLNVNCIGKEVPSLLAWRRSTQSDQFIARLADGYEFVMYFQTLIDYGCVRMAVFSSQVLRLNAVCDQSLFNIEQLNASVVPVYSPVGVYMPGRPNGDDQRLCRGAVSPVLLNSLGISLPPPSPEYVIIPTRRNQSYTVSYFTRLFISDILVEVANVSWRKPDAASVSISPSASLEANATVRQIGRLLSAGLMRSPIVELTLHLPNCSLSFERSSPCHIVNTVVGHTRIVAIPFCNSSLGRPIFRLHQPVSCKCNISYSDTNISIANAFLAAIDATSFSLYFGSNVTHASYIVEPSPIRSCSYYTDTSSTPTPITCASGDTPAYTCTRSCSRTGFPDRFVLPKGMWSVLAARNKGGAMWRRSISNTSGYVLDPELGYPEGEALNQSDIDGNGYADARDKDLYYRILAGTVPFVHADYTSCDTARIDLAAIYGYQYDIRLLWRSGVYKSLSGHLFVHNTTTNMSSATIAGLPVSTFGDVRIMVHIRQSGHSVGGVYHIGDPRKLARSCRSNVTRLLANGKTRYTINAEYTTVHGRHRQYIITPRNATPELIFDGFTLRRQQRLTCCMFATYSVAHDVSSAADYKWTNQSHPGNIGIGGYNQVPVGESSQYSNIGFYSTITSGNGGQQLCGSEPGNDDDGTPILPPAEFFNRTLYIGNTYPVPDSVTGYRIESRNLSRSVRGGDLVWSVIGSRSDLAHPPITDDAYTEYSRVRVAVSTMFTEFRISLGYSLAFKGETSCFVYSTIPGRTRLVVLPDKRCSDAYLTPLLRAPSDSRLSGEEITISSWTDVLAFVPASPTTGVLWSRNDRRSSDFTAPKFYSECGQGRIRFDTCDSSARGRRSVSPTLSPASDVNGDGTSDGVDTHMYYMVVGGLVPYITASYINCSVVHMRLILMTGYTYSVAIFNGNQNVLAYVNGSDSVVMDSVLVLNVTLPPSAIGDPTLGVVAWQTGGSGPDPEAERALFYVQNPLSVCDLVVPQASSPESSPRNTGLVLGFVVGGLVLGMIIASPLLLQNRNRAYTSVSSSDG